MSATRGSANGGCGSPFEPVGERLQLVRFRAVAFRERLTALDGDLLDRRTEEADARLVVPACPG